MKVAKSRGSVSNQTTLSRAHSPHGAPTAGAEPYFQGPNVLTDPGFENFVMNSGGWRHIDRPDGVNTYTLPYLDVTCASFKQLPDGTCSTKTFTSWVQCSGPYTVNDAREDQAWKVSVDSPDAGDYGAVWWAWNVGGGGVPAEICVLSPFVASPFSARVNPGDSVTWSVRAKVGSTIGTPQIQPIIRYHNAAWTIVGQALGTVSNLTGSYATYTVSSAAPPNTRYVRVAAQYQGATTNNGPTYLDSAVLGVT